MDCANCFSSPPVRPRRRKPRPPPLVRIRNRTKPCLDNRPPTPYPSQFIRPSHRALPNRPVRLQHLEAVEVTVRRPRRRATIVEIPPPEHPRRPPSTYHRPSGARRQSTSESTFVVPLKSPSREHRHTEESIRLKIAKQNAEINARPPLPFSSRRSRDAPDDFLRSFSDLNLGHGARK